MSWTHAMRNQNPPRLPSQGGVREAAPPEVAQPTPLQPSITHIYSRRRLAALKPVTSRARSCNPRHKVLTPGIPSRFRFMCPPRRPIHEPPGPASVLTAYIPSPKRLVNDHDLISPAAQHLKRRRLAAHAPGRVTSRSEPPPQALTVTAFSSPSQVSNWPHGSRFYAPSEIPQIGPPARVFPTSSPAPRRIRRRGLERPARQWIFLELARRSWAPTPPPCSRPSCVQDTSPGPGTRIEESTALQHRHAAGEDRKSASTATRVRAGHGLHLAHRPASLRQRTLDPAVLGAADEGAVTRVDDRHHHLPGISFAVHHVDLPGTPG